MATAKDGYATRKISYADQVEKKSSPFKSYFISCLQDKLQNNVSRNSILSIPPSIAMGHLMVDPRYITLRMIMVDTDNDDCH